MKKKGQAKKRAQLKNKKVRKREVGNFKCEWKAKAKIQMYGQKVN